MVKKANKYFFWKEKQINFGVIEAATIAWWQNKRCERRQEPEHHPPSAWNVSLASCTIHGYTMPREALSFGEKKNGADLLQTLRFAAPPHTDHAWQNTDTPCLERLFLSGKKVQTGCKLCALQPHPIRTTRGKLCPPQDGQLNRASIMIDGKCRVPQVGTP